MSITASWLYIKESYVSTRGTTRINCIGFSGLVGPALITLLAWDLRGVTPRGFCYPFSLQIRLDYFVGTSFLFQDCVYNSHRNHVCFLIYLFLSSIYCQIYLGNSGEGQNTVLFDEQANDQLSFQKYYSLLVLSLVNKLV